MPSHSLTGLATISFPQPARSQLIIVAWPPSVPAAPCTLQVCSVLCSLVSFIIALCSTALPPSRHPALAPRHSLQGTEPPPPSPRNQFPRRGTSLHEPDLHGLSVHGSLSHKPLSLSLLIQGDTLQYLWQSNVTMLLVIDSRGY